MYNILCFHFPLTVRLVDGQGNLKIAFQFQFQFPCILSVDPSRLVPKMEMKNIFIFNFSKNCQFTGPNRERIFSDFQFYMYFAEQNWNPSFFLRNIRKKLERPDFHHPFWDME
jgi:hypothetical protein